MKFFTFILIGCAGIFSVIAMSDDMKEMMKSISDECKKSEGATDKDVELMCNEEYPSSKEGWDS